MITTIEAGNEAQIEDSHKTQDLCLTLGIYFSPESIARIDACREGAELVLLSGLSRLQPNAWWRPLERSPEFKARIGAYIDQFADQFARFAVTLHIGLRKELSNVDREQSAKAWDVAVDYLLRELDLLWARHVDISNPWDRSAAYQVFKETIYQTLRQQPSSPFDRRNGAANKEVANAGPIDRRAAVNRFLEQCNREQNLGIPIVRKHI